MRLRSLLYVPAHAGRFIAKAHERGADAIILDLEDGVPPAEKQNARNGLRDSIREVSQGGAAVFVRVNADPGLQRDDALAACRAGAVGLYLPKVGNPSEINELGEIVAPVESALGRAPLRFVALVEDPAAVLDARSIARLPRVMALALGSEDLAFRIGAEPTPDMLRFPKLMVHYAAKAEGRLSFGLMRSIADYTALGAIAEAAREARGLGFDGASCVHPSAVPVLNAAFAPSAAEKAWAHRVLEAAAGRPGAFALDGRMIDAPVLARARRILDRDDRLA